jgi:uncharacterized membrane protein
MEPVFYRFIYEDREKPSEGEIMKTSAILVGLIGIILVILGVLEFVVRHFPGRGSGIGTVMLIIGLVLLVVAFWRMSAKPPAK